ncbi:DNA endonuclease RBBP8 [Biomphalaria pfeifferi]|uniref:DNA endonuclease RBBP8 n=1 Tax=Biomphalaria pfeifferi TaxID=112525 RepID=A0AAD8C4Y0_BIOPF|nr:DNA endonuclease RBBP8 [Biomphalaria pfeifferi]
MARHTEDASQLDQVLSSPIATPAQINKHLIYGGNNKVKEKEKFDDVIIINDEDEKTNTPSPSSSPPLLFPTDLSFLDTFDNAVSENALVSSSNENTFTSRMDVLENLSSICQRSRQENDWSDYVHPDTDCSIISSYDVRGAGDTITLVEELVDQSKRNDERNIFYSSHYSSEEKSGDNRESDAGKSSSCGLGSTDHYTNAELFENGVLINRSKKDLWMEALAADSPIDDDSSPKLISVGISSLEQQQLKFRTDLTICTSTSPESVLRQLLENDRISNENKCSNLSFHSISCTPHLECASTPTVNSVNIDMNNLTISATDKSTDITNIIAEIDNLLSSPNPGPSVSSISEDLNCVRLEENKWLPSKNTEKLDDFSMNFDTTYMLVKDDSSVSSEAKHRKDSEEETPRSFSEQKENIPKSPRSNALNNVSDVIVIEDDESSHSSLSSGPHSPHWLALSPSPSDLSYLEKNDYSDSCERNETNAVCNRSCSLPDSGMVLEENSTCETDETRAISNRSSSLLDSGIVFEENLTCETDKTIALNSTICSLPDTGMITKENFVIPETSENETFFQSTNNMHFHVNLVNNLVPSETSQNSFFYSPENIDRHISAVDSNLLSSQDSNASILDVHKKYSAMLEDRVISSEVNKENVPATTDADIDVIVIEDDKETSPTSPSSPISCSSRWLTTVPSEAKRRFLEPPNCSSDSSGKSRTIQKDDSLTFAERSSQQMLYHLSNQEKKNLKECCYSSYIHLQKQIDVLKECLIAMLKGKESHLQPLVDTICNQNAGELHTSLPQSSSQRKRFNCYQEEIPEVKKIKPTLESLDTVDIEEEQTSEKTSSFPISEVEKNKSERMHRECLQVSTQNKLVPSVAAEMEVCLQTGPGCSSGPDSVASAGCKNSYKSQMHEPNSTIPNFTAINQKKNSVGGKANIYLDPAGLSALERPQSLFQNASSTQNNPQLNKFNKLQLELRDAEEKITHLSLADAKVWKESVPLASEHKIEMADQSSEEKHEAPTPCIHLDSSRTLNLENKQNHSMQDFVVGKLRQENQEQADDCEVADMSCVDVIDLTQDEALEEMGRAAVVDVDVVSEECTGEHHLDDLSMDSFDRVPKKTIQEIPHVQVVRSKEARKKLKGSTCTECSSYYQSFELPDEVTQQKINKSSCHRDKHPRSRSPNNFWKIDFPETVENRPNEQNESPSHHRRRKPLQKGFKSKSEDMQEKNTELKTSGTTL